MDDFLQKYLDRFEQWSREGTISSSSRVVPVGSVRDARQWIVPSEHALAIIKGVQTIALQKCVCRLHYSLCDNPLEVCLVFNEVAHTLVNKGIARIISQKEASDLLTQADAQGLSISPCTCRITRYSPCAAAVPAAAMTSGSSWNINTGG